MNVRGSQLLNFRRALLRRLLFILIIFIVVPTQITPSILQSDIFYQIANSYEGPVEACSRGKGVPVPRSYQPQVSWNLTTFLSVVKSINKTVDPSATNGIKGCCSPGLWCSKKTGTCFTQSYGSQFVNAEWLNNDLDSSPVYACYSRGNNINTALSISGLGYSGAGNLNVYGKRLGADESTMATSMSGESCGNQQLCNSNQCRPCSISNPCPLDSVCLTENSRSSAYCYMLCSNTNDTACPCGGVCQRIRIDVPGSSGYTKVPTALCGYSGTSSCSQQALGSSSLLSCQSPRSARKEIVSRQPVVVSAAVDSTGGASTGAADTLTATYSQASLGVPSSGTCKTASDCIDGNICTIDSCVSGYCSYSSVSGCSSTLQTIRERSTPFVYKTYYQRSMKAQQKSFYTTVTKSGVGSIATDSSSYELFTYHLPFSFPYFGTTISSVTLNSDGTISLPPVVNCTDVACFTFSTFSNTISPWSSLFDFNGFNGAPTCYYLSQTAGDGSNVYGIDATAAHFVFDNFVYLDRSSLNKFAVSIYKDGSIGFRYIQVVPEVYDYTTNFYGIWSSRAALGTASSPGYTYYHKENVSYAIAADSGGGTDVVFCPLVQMIGCIQNACVSPSSVLTMQWGGGSQPTCSAMANTAPSLSCVWAGGLMTTPATFSGQNLQCTVPALNLPDGTVVKVDVSYNLNYGGSAASAPVEVNNLPGTKGAYGVTVGINGEMANSNLMVRYYGNSAAAGSCGCSALREYPSMTCDKSLVCGGSGTTLDCAGTPFGSAYLDSCGVCSGGTTGRTPDVSWKCGGNNGNSGGSGDNGPILNVSMRNSADFTFAIQLVLIIIIISIVSLIFYGGVKCARAFAYRRAHLRMLMAGEWPPPGMDGNAMRNNGLTEFEIEALGKRVYDERVYREYSKEEGSLRGIGSGGDNSNMGRTQRQDDEDEDGDEENPSANNANNTRAPPVECTICLSDITAGQECMLLPPPCSHLYHAQCISSWFQNSSYCPLCKRSLRDILEGGDGMVPEPERPRWTPNRGASSTSAAETVEMGAAQQQTGQEQEQDIHADEPAPAPTATVMTADDDAAAQPLGNATRSSSFFFPSFFRSAVDHRSYAPAETRPVENTSSSTPVSASASAPAPAPAPIPAPTIVLGNERSTGI